MELRSRWRHFWAQRSRFRLTLAVICLVAALVIVGFIYVPDLWLARGGAALQAAGMYVLSFGSRSLLFAAGGVFLVCAVLLVVLPRRRPHAYWASGSPASSEVAVYLDLENQISNTELRPFIRLLRKRLGGRKADLYYFADASKQAAGKMYQEIWRFGFRPVDVPHRHLGVQNVKNIVDVELSLFAYERALLGPSRQDIILIAADQDYLPLVYRLRALGHKVAVWGRVVPDSYKSLQTYLDVEVFEFGTAVAGTTAPHHTAPGGARPTTRPRARKQSTESSGSFATTAEPGSLIGAIRMTSELADRMAVRQISAERRVAAFYSQLGALAPTFLKPIGYDGSNRSICWIEVLSALGVLSTAMQQDAPRRGSSDAVAATQALETFLQVVARLALTLASQTANSVIRYVDLSRRMSQPDTAVLPPGHDTLLALVSPAHGHRIAHIRYLSFCARSLGLLDFDEVIPGTAIQLRQEVAQGTSPAMQSTRPEMDDTHEDAH
jgi:hypothetical protein